MMDIAIGIVIIVLCIVIEGFFSGSEIGIISCDRIRMSSLVDKKDKRAKFIISFLEDPEKFLSTTLVGVNLSVITASSVATAIASRYIDTPGRDAMAATIIILPLVLIFGEIIPKVIYQQHPVALSLVSAYPLRAASIVLFPFVFFASRISSLVSRVFGRETLKKNPYVSREEIRLLMLEASKEGVLAKSEIDMTSEIFDFGKTNVQSVMVPLGNVISASSLSTVKDIMELVRQSGYSRIPIYGDREDNIIGTIEMSDLVAEDAEKRDLRTFIRPSYNVDADRSIESVLKDFQNNQKNVAIVIDKNGKALGMATLEDIVEEIIGEVEDEYDVSR